MDIGKSMYYFSNGKKLSDMGPRELREYVNAFYQFLCKAHGSEDLDPIAVSFIKSRIRKEWDRRVESKFGSVYMHFCVYAGADYEARWLNFGFNLADEESTIAMKRTVSALLYMNKTQITVDAFLELYKKVIRPAIDNHSNPVEIMAAAKANELTKHIAQQDVMDLYKVHTALYYPEFYAGEALETPRNTSAFNTFVDAIIGGVPLHFARKLEWFNPRFIVVAGQEKGIKKEEATGMAGLSPKPTIKMSEG